MKIKYLAHASFLITSDSGLRIITDPYAAGGGIKHGEIKETADIVTISHEHHDHNNAGAIGGNPKVVRSGAEVKGIKIKAVPTAHDDKGGGQRGKNTIFCFEVDGVKVCHCGDLGHVLTDEQVKAIGGVDVLMIPVGGFFTVDAGTAHKVIDQLKPKVAIPMHYKTEKLDFPIAGVDEFIKGKGNVTRPGDSEIELKAGSLPAATRIVVLKQSL
jgi:L-ascorbate metabolism protein UlaG (beta-lactamase superfamily)